MPDGDAWPRISIVTPSYDQGQFIEETIRSVLLQGYPDLEYIIIDGGSTDGAVEVIRKYEHWLSYWKSAPDKGQADAINKGLARATGGIFAWVNSDDYYHPDIFGRAGDKIKDKTTSVSWIAMAIEFLEQDSGKRKMGHQTRYRNLRDLIPTDNYIHSSGVFWNSDLTANVGLMDVNLHYAFDKEYWIRFLREGFVLGIDNTVTSSTYRCHDSSKTVTSSTAFKYEWAEVGLRYARNAEMTRSDIWRLRDLFVHSAVRLAQSEHFSRSRRIKYLVDALERNPFAVFRRDFIGTCRRVFRAS